jgi:hypothetical protein
MSTRKIKVRLSMFFLIKYYAIETYGGVEVWLPLS